MVKKTNVLFIAIFTLAAAANIYYCLPLIPLIAQSFVFTPEETAQITCLVQVGCLAGLLLVQPLADLMERKLLIMIGTLSAAVFWLTAAISPAIFLLGLSFFIIGISISAVLSQLILLSLSTDVYYIGEKKAENIGIVLSFLFAGLLVANPISGAAALIIGWRLTFVMASGICFAITGGVYLKLPKSYPAMRISYIGAFKKMISNFNNRPALAMSSLLNAFSFLVVSAFWVVMILRLSSPAFHFNSLATGSFGLAGVAVVSAISFGGYLYSRASRNSASRIILAGLLCEFLSFIVFQICGSSLLLFISGVLLLNGGHHLIQIVSGVRAGTAQSGIEDVRSFMTSYFASGTMGMVLGIIFWVTGGWTIFCSGCLVLVLINFIIHYLSLRVI